MKQRDALKFLINFILHGQIYSNKIQKKTVKQEQFCTGVDDSGVVTRGQEHQPQPGDSNLPTNLRYQQSDASIKSPSPDSGK